jgi:hypothetical protein
MMIKFSVWVVLAYVLIGVDGAEPAEATELPQHAIVNGKRVQPRPGAGEKSVLPEPRGFRAFLKQNGEKVPTGEIPRDLYGRPFQVVPDDASNSVK